MTTHAESDAAPPAAPVTPSATQPWWRRRRTIVITASVTAVALAAAVGIIAADTEAARTEYLTIRESVVQAEAHLHELTTALDAAIADATDVALVIETVLAIDGAGLDPAAREPLAAAAADAALPESFPGTLPPPIVALEGGTAAQWRQHTAAQVEWIDALDRQQREIAADIDAARATTENLTVALAAYLGSAAAAGAALLAERTDADTDSTSALQGSIDALPQTAPADASARLDAHVAAAAAVIASSDAARRAQGPTGGAGGSGYRIPDPGSFTAVVNKARSLSAAYAPTDLRRPAGVGNALPLRDAAATAAEQMAADMAAAGITLRMSSGYRSYSRQQTIYSGFVAREGVAGADQHSARPGHSEHQTGLAADFDDGSGCNLKVCFRDRPGGIWLAENAWKYGWILRYGDGWQPIVGYRFEPWHYRYVGVDVASAMHASGVSTLEEHFGTGAAPDYVH